MGQIYGIACNVAVTSPSVDTQNQSSLAACIAACDLYNLNTFYTANTCLGVTYYPAETTNNCELKSGFITTRQAGANSAQLLTIYNGPGNNFSTTVSGGGSIGTMTVSGIGGYGGGGGYGSGGGGYGTATIVSNGQTIFSTYGVSTYVSNGVALLSTYGVSTAYDTSLVPSTIYGVSTAVSTYVSNGITEFSTYGVSTVVSVVYLPASTVTTTTTTLSISISVSTVAGPTVTASGGGGGVVTITEGGGNFITITNVITETVAPSSKSSTFSCRTYATNYLNGMHGRRVVKRSVFDFEGDPNAPRPGAVPILDW